MTTTLAVTQQNRTQPSLGRGPIGAITPEHVAACNAWLLPLAQCDGFMAQPSVGAEDIRNLLELGRVSNAQFSGDIRRADNLKMMLLVDFASVVRTIRWGMAPQEDEPTMEMLCRLTARGRRMLLSCCKDLWDQMLFGKPEGRYGSHAMSNSGPCSACRASPEMIEDAIVSKECPQHVPEKGTILRKPSRGTRFFADGNGGFTTAPEGAHPL